MRKTNEIDDPTWQDILDRDAENERLREDAERWHAAKRKFTHLAYEHRWQYTDQDGCDAEAREMEFLELNDAAIDEAMKDDPI